MIETRRSTHEGASMDLKTFQAPTMSEALAEVKSTLGPGAVILHTRTFSRRGWLGLRRQEIVEITAGRSGNSGDRGARRPIPSRPRPSPLIAAPDRPLGMLSNSRQILESPAAQSAAMLGLTQEMTNIKGLVQDLVEQTRQQRLPNIPAEYHALYSRLVRNQVCQNLAADMIQTLHRQIRPEHARQSDFIRDKLLEQIEKLLPLGSPLVRGTKMGPHVVALIGPTGVGKTTTLAKLAANLKIRERCRVGMITLDTYRIAAIDQLGKYADLIESPLRVVSRPEEMSAALQAMKDCQFVLIDTAGRSPNDAMKLGELRSFLAVARPDEVHLVLSSTSSQQCVELALDRFGKVRSDKIIFTKLDEAAHCGVVLNIIRKTNKSLSYITTGQDVPKDIEVGGGRRLAQMILGSDDLGGGACQ
jgi:flagellar biosynthesis protein FlhF